MNRELPKTFCPLAWNQLHVTPIGVVKPCCVFDGSLVGENNKVVRISDDEIEKVWNGSALKELRLKMLKGEKIAECKKCYEEEKLSNTSDRTRALMVNPVASEMIASSSVSGEVSELPTILNLKIGNKCNLKCRMCQPLDSGMIDTEFKEISAQEPRFRSFDNANAFDYNYSEFPIEYASKWIEDERAKKNIFKLLSNANRLFLAGGETTFTEEAIDILKFCVENNLSKNIRAVISSNLTRMGDDIVKLMSEFNCFRVVASIDGVENLAEYIRYPSKWNVIKNNFNKIVNAPSNVIPVIAPTIQIYNILNIVEVFDFIEKMDNPKWESEIEPACHLTVLLDPQHLSIRHLPKKIKVIALERLLEFEKRSKVLLRSSFGREQFKLLLDTLREERFDAGSGITSEEYMSHFLQYTLDLDKQRNQRLQDYIPELYDLLLEENIKPQYPKSDPRNYTYYKYRDTGFRLQSENKTGEAINMFNNAYEMFAEDPDLLLSLGFCYNQEKNKPMSYKVFNELIAISPENPHGLKELGILLMSDKKYSEALVFFQRGIKQATLDDGNVLKKLIEECRHLSV